MSSIPPSRVFWGPGDGRAAKWKENQVPELPHGRPPVKYTHTVVWAKSKLLLCWHCILSFSAAEVRRSWLVQLPKTCLCFCLPPTRALPVYQTSVPFFSTPSRTWSSIILRSPWRASDYIRCDPPSPIQCHKVSWHLLCARHRTGC